MGKVRFCIEDEIESWRQEGVISDAQAQQLSARYQDGEQDRDWSRIIFSSLGVVIFALGIILFLAYNWESLHRYAKLAMIAVSLALAHGAGWWFGRGGESRLSESLHLLGTMLFGAGIWLVAQIYHIDEHYPNAYLVWSLAALSLAWALPSRTQGLLALALVFLWSWFEVFDFYQPNYWAPWLVGGGVMPLAWVLRSRVLLFFSLALFMLLYALMLMRVSDELVFGTLLMSACACLAGYYLAPHTGFSGSADVFRLVGLGIYLLLLYLGSFAGLSDELFRWPTGQWQDWLFWGIPLAAALLSWASVLIRHRACLVTGLERAEAGLIVLTLLMVATSSAVFADGASWLVFNVVFLLHGAILLIQGTQGLLWKRTALGGLMLAALVFARFMDLFDNLLIRSLTFLLVGAGLFVIGHLYARRKQKLAGATPLTGTHSDGSRLDDDRTCADGGKQGDE